MYASSSLPLIWLLTVVQQPVAEHTLIQVDNETEFTLNNTEFTQY